ncbi:hypothetical protein AOLI_G00102900 [Acnodon oligacanthus]
MADTQEPESAEGLDVTPATRPGPFVTFREPVAEISSLFSDMYIQDSGVSDEEDATVRAMINRSAIQEANESANSLQNRADPLEGDFRASAESAVNREHSLKAYVDQKFEDLELLLKRSRKPLKQGVAACLLRRGILEGTDFIRPEYSRAPAYQSRNPGRLSLREMSPCRNMVTPSPREPSHSRGLGFVQTYADLHTIFKAVYQDVSLQVSSLQVGEKGNESGVWPELT